jgi:glycosyltransferase involved in cell wall biosynthesis
MPLAAMARLPLSIIVVFHNMAREAPRTLQTLSPAYQRGVDASDYEVIAVDAGSTSPLDPGLISGLSPGFRLLRTPPAPSPAAAVNAAARSAEGEAIALCIDGARMLSPGVVAGLLAGLRVAADPVVATLAWHLGPKVQNESIAEGYDQAAEDRLLASVDWQTDGYELFRISTLASSSGAGWFLPLSESNCLAVPRASWETLGGLEERFVAPGGGLVNLDFYRRACDRAESLVLLLGEGSFHQVHGGVATNAPRGRHPFPSFHAEYQAIRGEPFSPPVREPILLGGMPRQAVPFLAHSITALGSA